MRVRSTGTAVKWHATVFHVVCLAEFVLIPLLVGWLVGCVWFSASGATELGQQGLVEFVGTVAHGAFGSFQHAPWWPWCAAFLRR